jgi:chromate transporter
MNPIVQMVLDFSLLSLIAFGGMTAVLPELHRGVVGVHAWMDDRTFVDLYGLGYALPGPNVLVVTLIAAYVGGPVAAIVASAAIMVPSMLLATLVAGVWHRFRDTPGRRWIQSGLLAVVVGLTMAGGLILTQSAAHAWTAYLLTAVTVAIVSVTRLHPLWLIGIGAVLGIAGIL